MSSTKQPFDVVISGGGLSGLLTAIGLLRECESLNIAIIEPNQMVEQTLLDNFDGRCLALSYGSLQLMNHWQIWSELKPLAWPIKTIVTSDRGHVGKTIMKAENYQLNAMGYVAEMRNIGVVLQRALKQMPEAMQNRLSWFCPDTIKSVSINEHSTEIELASGNTLQAKLMVVAEGANSPTRALLGIDTQSNDYEQVAMVANVKVKGAETKLAGLLGKHRDQVKDVAQHVAFERFTTSGPIAFLPIGKQSYSLVWTETPQRVESIMAMSDEAFCHELQQAFGYAAGQVVSVSQRSQYPLKLIKANAMMASRAAIVGNAAHTLHPIAGQGFNLGLRDIAVLVESIKQASLAGQDIGGFELLNQYQNNRRKDVNRITGFTDLLVRSFALEGRLPALTRTLSLMALQKIESLQHWLAMQFMSSKSLSNIPQLKE